MKFREFSQFFSKRKSRVSDINLKQHFQMYVAHTTRKRNQESKQEDFPLLTSYHP
jgi:hypothetical protein